MKSKKSILIAIIFIVIGLGVTTYAYFDSGWSTFNFNTKYGNVGLGVYNNNDKDKKSVNNPNYKVHSESNDLENFTSIDSKLLFSNIEIIPHNENTSKIEIEYKNENTFNIDVKNGILTLKEVKVKRHYNNVKINNIILYVPENIKFSNLNIFLNFGNYKLENLNTDKLTITNDYGNVDISNSINNETNISLDSGNLTSINSEFMNLDISNDYGNIKFTNIKSEKSNIELNSGSIELTDCIINNNNIDNDYGDINLDNTQFKNSKIEIDSGNFKANNSNIENLQIENDYGDVNIIGTITGQNKFSLSSGKLDLNLQQDSTDTKYKISVDSGTVTVDKELLIKSEGSKTINDSGTNYIEVISDYGNININHDK